MNIKGIGSSSKGNCYIINDGITTLMIECGIGINRLRAEGINLPSINAILVTHEHKDHCKYWEQVYLYAPLYTTAGTIKEMTKESKKPIYEYNLHSIITHMPFKVGTFLIKAFETEHDAAEPVGYYLYSTVTKERLLFATDTYFIRYRFDNLNYILIECNYKKEYLDANENLPKSARIRLLKSHFELSHLCDFLKANDLSKVKEIYLMHLSAGNSNAEEFKKTIQELTGIPTYIFKE